MNEHVVEGTLESFLVQAREGQLPNGWLYLAQSSPGLGTRCLLVMDPSFRDDSPPAMPPH